MKISKATATVSLGNLAQTYTGSPLAATATTSPTGLTVGFTYDGSATAPTAAGSYAVVATINDATQVIWDKDAGFTFKRLEHPRLALLRSQVVSLPVDEQYRAALLKSIDTYRDQILARPLYAPDEGWDDLEALQQVTLGDVMERALQEKFEEQSRSNKPESEE